MVLSLSSSLFRRKQISFMNIEQFQSPQLNTVEIELIREDGTSPLFYSCIDILDELVRLKEPPSGEWIQYQQQESFRDNLEALFNDLDSLKVERLVFCGMNPDFHPLYGEIVATANSYGFDVTRIQPEPNTAYSSCFIGNTGDVFSSKENKLYFGNIHWRSIKQIWETMSAYKRFSGYAEHM